VVVASRYQVRKLLGSGASGEVWQAEDLATDGLVALKKLRTGCAGPELRSRFRREAQLYARVDSDRVARLLDLVVDDTFGTVQVLEHVDGEPLSDLLKRRCLTVEEAIELGLDLLLGVADLHREMVVHRDLKPANVLLRKSLDGELRAVIVDLGAGRALGDGDGDDELTGITRGPMVIGTLAYLAPEQLIDSRAVSAAADLYAVGVILYRAVSGSTPFGGLCQLALVSTKRREEAPMLITGRSDARARAFEDLLITALKRRSAERFLTSEDMRRALEAARDAPGPEAEAAASALQCPLPAEPESSLTTLPHDVGAARALLAPSAEPAPEPAASPTHGRESLPPDAVALPAHDAIADSKLRRRRKLRALAAAAAMLSALAVGGGAGWRAAMPQAQLSRRSVEATAAQPTPTQEQAEIAEVAAPANLDTPPEAPSEVASAAPPRSSRAASSAPRAPSLPTPRGTRPAAPVASAAQTAAPDAAPTPPPLDTTDPWGAADADATSASGDAAGPMPRAAQLEPVR
jgi:serine/threonine-protein kinase